MEAMKITKARVKFDRVKLARRFGAMFAGCVVYTFYFLWIHDVDHLIITWVLFGSVCLGGHAASTCAAVEFDVDMNIEGAKTTITKR